MSDPTNVDTNGSAQDPATRPSLRKTRKTNGAELPPPQSPVDVFSDLDALRLDPGASLAGTTEVLMHVPVRKPSKLEFIRIHPDEAMSLATSIFRDDDERADYLVLPPIRPLLLGYLKPVQLVTTITRQGTLLLWPVPLPDPESSAGRSQPWGETARQAAAMARDKWLRLKPDMDLGSYRVILAEGALPDPVWPDTTLQELMRIGFRDRVIDNTDHPIIRKLRGLS